MINDATTKDLIKELMDRKGASEIQVKQGEQFEIKTDNLMLKDKGRAMILIISLEDTDNAYTNCMQGSRKD